MAPQEPGTSEENDSDDSSVFAPDAQQLKKSKHAFDNATTADESAGSVDSRKRKRLLSVTNELSRKRRLAEHYNDDYRILFNEEVTEARERFVSIPDSHKDPLSSQIGSTIWMAQEKALFFDALTRLGKANIPGITAAVRTKSQLEVTEYLKLLGEGLIQHVLHDKEQVTCGHADIPAAVELSEECCEALDVAGEALACFQDTYDCAREQEKYGDHWLLTADLAEQVESQVAASRRDEAIEPESGAEHDGANDNDQKENDSDKDMSQNDSADPADLLTSIPAAKLLNLPKWLHLSHTIFMQTCPSENWQTLADDPGEEPAIFHTAFRDFHQLALSITRRLVQATIFQASSRIRSEDYRTSKATQPIVHDWDVHAAIDILGLKRNAKDYWARLPRRLDLTVYDEKQRLDQKDAPSSKTYTHAETEHLLGLPSTPPPPTRNETDPSSSSDTESSSSSSSTSPPSLQPHDDARALHLDTQATLTTSHALLSLLSHNNPSPLPTHPPPPRARLTRKSLPEVTDWRSHTSYKPAWTTRPPSPPPEPPAPPAANVAYAFKVPTKEKVVARKKNPLPRPRTLRREGGLAGKERGDDDDVNRDDAAVSRTLPPRSARADAVLEMSALEYLPDGQGSGSGSDGEWGQEE